MEFLDIAVPLVSNALTFFIGSGFSKYLTNNSAPGWLELLVGLGDLVDDGSHKLLKALFNVNSEDAVVSPKMELSICGQILELEFKRKDKDIRQLVVEILAESIEGRVDEEKRTRIRNFFEKHRGVNIVTTNYDTLLTDYILPNFSKVVTEGSPIPRSDSGTNVLHIHGCISNPSSIVLTISDYFRFLHRDSYLSRKFYTLLQETTVVMLGYSLGDFNLNSIFNEALTSRAVSLGKSDIFLISKYGVDDVLREYYSHTYGIHVVGGYDIGEFFAELDASAEGAKRIADEARNLPDVLSGMKVYTNDYLRRRDSLQQILLQASMIGARLEERAFSELISNILLRKKEFTRETGAWQQYDHLAEWLIEVGSRVNVAGTKLEEVYSELVKYSFRNMSKARRFGYSWDAFATWVSRVKELRPDNQKLIKRLVEEQFQKEDDAYEIIL